ncbi:MAG: type II toxin-antitoxin system Phd/YefM family antitoxin [Nitrospirota bacterium]
MKYINVTTARASLLRLVDDIDERTAIMRNGQPVAVLLDFDDYQGLCAAEALARDPQRLAAIRAVAQRVSEGNLDGFEQVPDSPGSDQPQPIEARDALESLEEAQSEYPIEGEREDVPPATAGAEEPFHPIRARGTRRRILEEAKKAVAEGILRARDREPRAR